MTNYQDSSDQPTGAGPGHVSAPTGPPPTGSPGYQGTTYPDTGHQQQWAGAGMGHPGPQHQRRSLNVKSAFKTTEFWVLVVVSIALLIAAAVTDQGDDGQGFGSQDAWRYITILGAAYMISRGLTKFSGRDEHDHHSSGA